MGSYNRAACLLWCMLSKQCWRLSKILECINCWPSLCTLMHFWQDCFEHLKPLSSLKKFSYLLLALATILFLFSYSIKNKMAWQLRTEVFNLGLLMALMFANPTWLEMGDFPQMKTGTFPSPVFCYNMKHLFSFLVLSFSPQKWQFNIIS